MRVLWKANTQWTTRAGRVRLAAVLAILGAAFLGIAGYSNFTALRIRAVKEPIAANTDGVSVSVSPAKRAGLAAPFALVARLHNDSAAAKTIAIRLDGLLACAPTVPAGQSVRADCQFSGPWDPAVDHQVAFTDRDDSWQLEALELSTHHGSNAAFVRAYVLPAASRAYQPPGVLACTAWALVLFALLLVQSPPLPRALRVAQWIVVAFFACWAIAVTAAPYVSSYRIIVSANTVRMWLLACLAPQVYYVGRRFLSMTKAWVGTLGPIPKAAIGAALVVACFAVVTQRRVAIEYNGNYSGLLALSHERVEANPWLQERPDVKRGLIAPDNNGYDGQFMYAIAFDPFARRFHDQPKAYQPFIDSPPYRYGRVGFPLLTRIVALGHPERFPAVMAMTIYAGVFLAALSLGWLSWRSGHSPWWALSIALIPGFWASLRFGLPEPLAAGAVVAGYLCVTQRRYLWGAVFLAAACLIRETSVFFVLCSVGWLAWSRQPREALKILIMALGPLCLWRLYVGATFAPNWGFEAYWNPPDDFGLPFGGIAALWSDLSHGRYYPDSWELRRGIICFSLIVIAASALSWMMLRARPGAITAAAAVFGLMAICFNLKNVWVATGNAERLTTDLFFCLALATPEFILRSRTWRASLLVFWSAVAAYLLFGTIDAAFTRESLLSVLGFQ